MKAFLLYRDRDLGLDGDRSPTDAAVIPRYRDPVLALRGDLSPNEAALINDLEAETLLSAMAVGDLFLFQIAWKVVLASLDESEAIRYRQHILADCLEQSAVVREIYAIAVEAIEGEKRVWGGPFINQSPVSSLHQSVNVLGLFVGLLKRLRRIADEHGAAFHSQGFRRFFDMIASELDDDYIRAVEDHLRRLHFRDGLPMSAELGALNKDTHYVLRRPRDARRSWREWIGFGDRSGYTYQVPDRDHHGFEALARLEGRGLALAADALWPSVDHILSFFSLLRSELGFYVGCLNLHEQLARKGGLICFPEPEPTGRVVLSARGLYDVCLSLSVAERVVGNDMSAEDTLLVMITGANGGGKSTFLRGIGLAQLMMQCGMFVAAESFRADVRQGIFTHFKREEDASLRSGKLDEELSRMSSIVDNLTPNSILLLNESFASTNEREGSEIARQIVRALLQTGIKVCYVTHMFDLAHGFALQELPTALFLRAERLADGRRTFRLVEGEPLPTSYGEDVYRQIFDAAPDASPAAAAGEVTLTPRGDA
jgi:DNA mismatch repair ATPase MutS